MCRRILIFVAISAVAPNAAKALVTSDGVGTHVVQPGVPMFGVDLDGVALIAGDVPGAETVGDLLPVCSAALISDLHLLTAAHCVDRDKDGQLDFDFRSFPHVAAFPLADRTELLRLNTRNTFVPESFVERPADLAILTLEVAAPVDIPRYTLYDVAEVSGSAVVISGFGETGSGQQGVVPDFDVESTKRAGRNRYEALRNGAPYPGLELLYYDYDSGQSNHNSLADLGIASDLGFGADEVVSGSGDSGGPAFLNGHIVAVTAFGGRYDDEPESSWGAIGIDVPVASFRDFILTATDHRAVFVPEPTGFLMSIIGFVTAGRSIIRRGQADRVGLDPIGR